ncbi:AI-2E family transporter [Pseudonocardia sp. K10HN5]|uniref:AI-2E family transporter n=2 Tax=Pseudonocardia acidicola TaxID=2724939 RepID=A0ABX1S8S3_9PSEU|nr:AI-2E family transporter [Pseudonocardia acidicola]NMH96972.1 AI-2E family transporter [Pseudonocardia acidicola]
MEVGPPLGHHPLVAQPHTDREGPIAEAEREAALLATVDRPLGQPGAPLNRRSPFIIGLTGAAGVAVTYVLFQVVVSAHQALVLIGLGLFGAMGLEPAVSYLARRWLPRWAAVTVVVAGLAVLVGGFLAAAIVPLATQSSALAQEAPRLLQQIHDRSTVLGQLYDRFQLQQRLEHLLSGDTSALLTGIFGAGAVVFSLVTSVVVVLVLTVYFLASLPMIRAVLYRFVPASRRPRAVLIGDAVFAKVGAYVLGTGILAVIVGLGTFIWLEIFHVPYALTLAILVGLLDLIPVIGSTLGGLIVSLVALTVSWPVALATAAFYVGYRFFEDYLLVPTIIGRTVKVPSALTVVAVLLGGVLLGVVGALVAIPTAAAVLLIVREVVFPRLDRA